MAEGTPARSALRRHAVRTGQAVWDLPPSAKPGMRVVSALARGRRQAGTLGSGNHYLEIQVGTGENVLDAQAAAAMGIRLPYQKDAEGLLLCLNALRVAEVRRVDGGWKATVVLDI